MIDQNLGAVLNSFKLAHYSGMLMKKLSQTI